MKKIISLVFVFIFVFSSVANAKFFSKDIELVDIILFENFGYENLKDDLLKRAGIDVNYIKIFNKVQKEITEDNFKELIVNFHNELIYEYRDVFGKKVSKTRDVYIFSEKDFRESVSIDNKYKIKNVSLDIVYNDTSVNKIFVGKIYSNPKLPEDKDCYIMKLDRNNRIIWGKLFEDCKINKFNKMINVNNDEYYVIASGYRESEWTDGFIAKLDGSGNFHWKSFYGSSHIDDFKDIVALDDGDVIVLAEVSNQDRDVKTHITINNPLNKDLVLLKYDSIGNIVWQNSIANENDLIGLKLINNNHNLIVIGEMFNYNDDNNKNIIVSSFDLDGRMRFYTVMNEFDENILNKLI